MSVPTELETKPGAKRVRMEPDKRRGQVLAVAAAVFAEKGYRAANVTDIVNGAGIGRGTFYLYFDSKKDVFLEIIEGYFEDFTRLLAENRSRLDEAIKGEGRALGIWRENILHILEYHRAHPDTTSVVYRDALGNDEHFATRVKELEKVARRQQREVFRLMQQVGLMRDCDLEVVTTMILGSVIDVIMEHVVGHKRVDLEALADEIIEYHVRALMNTDIEETRRFVDTR
jgi:AcrR family transcriptional regulator